MMKKVLLGCLVVGSSLMISSPAFSAAVGSGGGDETRFFRGGGPRRGDCPPGAMCIRPLNPPPQVAPDQPDASEDQKCPPGAMCVPPKFRPKKPTQPDATGALNCPPNADCASPQDMPKKPKENPSGIPGCVGPWHKIRDRSGSVVGTGCGKPYCKSGGESAAKELSNSEYVCPQKKRFRPRNIFQGNFQDNESTQYPVNRRVRMFRGFPQGSGNSDSLN